MKALVSYPRKWAIRLRSISAAINNFDPYCTSDYFHRICMTDFCRKGKSSSAVYFSHRCRMIRADSVYSNVVFDLLLKAEKIKIIFQCVSVYATTTHFLKFLHIIQKFINFGFINDYFHVVVLVLILFKEKIYATFAFYVIRFFSCFWQNIIKN